MLILRTLIRSVITASTGNVAEIVTILTIRTIGVVSLRLATVTAAGGSLCRSGTGAGSSWRWRRRWTWVATLTALHWRSQRRSTRRRRGHSLSEEQLHSPVVLRSNRNIFRLDEQRAATLREKRPRCWTIFNFELFLLVLSCCKDGIKENYFAEQTNDFSVFSHSDWRARRSFVPHCGPGSCSSSGRHFRSESEFPEQLYFWNN